MFAGLEHFPGSKQRRDEVSTPTGVDISVPEEEPLWISKGKVYRFGGEDIEFFPVSALAMALNREVATIYSWERKGWLPRPKFRGKTQGFGGRRRLYTERQIHAIVAVAESEGLLGDNPPSPGATRLFERAEEVFNTL